MSRRAWVVATVVTAGIVAALVLPQIGDAPGGRDRPSSSSASGGAADEARSDGKKSDGKKSDGKKSGVVASEITGSTVVTQPEGDGSASASDGLPGLEPVKPASSLISTPLPKTASKLDGVVAGFPQDVVPLPSGVVIESTGVSATAKSLQVSLVADSRRSARNLLAFHRRALTALGFTERSTPATGGSVATSFVKGEDHLVVTATAGPKRTTYSVFGTLHAGRRG